MHEGGGFRSRTLTPDLVSRHGQVLRTMDIDGLDGACKQPIVGGRDVLEEARVDLAEGYWPPIGEARYWIAEGAGRLGPAGRHRGRSWGVHSYVTVKQKLLIEERFARRLRRETGDSLR